MEKTRILIVDDSDVIIDGLRCILRPQPDFVVVGDAADGCEAIFKTKALRPDIVLMDAQMPVMDGVEATRCIKQMTPSVRVLILAVHETHMNDALDAGADGFLMKDSGRAELVREIRRLTQPSPCLATP